MKDLGRVEIIVEILRSALEASTRATIMNRSSITHPQIREYLPVLIENGLLEAVGETELYRTTPRGLYVISIYEQMERLSGTTNVVI